MDTHSDGPLSCLVLVASGVTGKVGLLFFAWCLFHNSFESLFHVEDANSHFWSVADWRFASPMPYWKPVHLGDVVHIGEIVAGLLMVGGLFYRF